MVAQYEEPGSSVQEELVATVQGMFSSFFDASNIHPHRLVINYRRSGAVWTASVTLHWQRASDFKFGQHQAHFEYVLREPPHGRDRYWHCTAGLPGN